MGETYYEASARPADAITPLAGGIRVDACVVGAGLTGLSAALALARSGARVVVLEAGRAGSGASGRNGGQLIPGFRHGAVSLVQRFGPDKAAALFALTTEARDHTASIAAGDPCGLVRAGHITAAIRPSDLADMQAEIACLERVMGHRQARLLDAAGMRAQVASPLYHGGLHDSGGGHLHPLDYVRTLARAARAGGVALHEATRAIDIQPGAPAAVTTSQGRVLADQVVLACDAQLRGLTLARRSPALRRRLMPVWSYCIATERLGQERATALLPGNAAVSDTRFVLDYFRRSQDGRLLFSGGERYVSWPAAGVEPIVRPRLEVVFPSLAGIGIAYAWAGEVGVTTGRFPQVGREQGVWFAHGYSGHGLLLAQASGRALAEAILGRPSSFNMLASLPGAAWPGGAAMRQPIYTAGMLWLALRDRW